MTIVELLVVVATIAMMLSLMLAGLKQARATASMVKCASNLSQIAKAGHAFAADHRARWVLDKIDNNSNNSLWYKYEQRYAHYGRLHRNYLADGSVFYCPGAQLFTVDHAAFGARNLGVIGQQAVSSYFQRGPDQGGPRNTRDKSSRALISDIMRVRGWPLNHGSKAVVVYLDGSAHRLNLPDDWSSENHDGHGGDSFPGGGDGAWSQLDQRSPF